VSMSPPEAFLRSAIRTFEEGNRASSFELFRSPFGHFAVAFLMIVMPAEQKTSSFLSPRGLF
jgi:hypothetical protein